MLVLETWNSAVTLMVTNLRSAPYRGICTSYTNS